MPSSISECNATLNIKEGSYEKRASIISNTQQKILMWGRCQHGIGQNAEKSVH